MKPTRIGKSLSGIVALCAAALIGVGALGYAFLRQPNGARQKMIPAAETKMVSLPVDGMSCSSCVASVKTAVSSIDGVTGVEVSLEHRQATVQYIPEKVSPQQIAGAIDKLGYKTGEPKIEEAR